MFRREKQTKIEAALLKSCDQDSTLIGRAILGGVSSFGDCHGSEFLGLSSHFRFPVCPITKDIEEVMERPIRRYQQVKTDTSYDNLCLSDEQAGHRAPVTR